MSKRAPKRAGEAVSIQPVPEVNADDYGSVGAVMVALMTDKLTVPVWIRVGSTSSLVTPDGKRAFCLGLMLALDMSLRK